MSQKQNLTLRCPECEAHLVIDASSCEVLEHRKPKQSPGGGKDFDALLESLDQERADTEDIFEREVAAMRDRDRLLDEKFTKAMKRAEEEPDDEPPIRPFDLD